LDPGRYFAKKDIMRLIAQILVALVALAHLWFLTLEMFLWTKPVGLRTFGQSLEKAQDSAVLAANQGLYNGFLAAGLIFGLLYPDPQAGRHIQIFFLICVVAAGAYGSYSVSLKILVVQAAPALLALVLLWLS
jgi:putative membrane protein